MATISDINTAVSAAIAAIESNDYDTALAKALAAQIYIASMPESELRDKRLRWDARGIDQLVDQIREAKRDAGSASAQDGGITRTSVKYIPTADY